MEFLLAAAPTGVAAADAAGRLDLDKSRVEANGKWPDTETDMRAKHRNLLVILGVLTLSGGRIGIAEAAGVTPGEAYSEQRTQLLAAGWKPNTGYGLKLSNGRPMHRYPEVLCGMDKCRAKWRDPSGAERSIMLIRGGLNEEYRVRSEE
jgi:hypothetical protein